MTIPNRLNPGFRLTTREQRENELLKPFYINFQTFESILYLAVKLGIVPWNPRQLGVQLYSPSMEND